MGVIEDFFGSETFDTIDAESLLAKPFPSLYFIVENILPTGLAILGGASKIGKSWFALQLCLCVAEGRDFLGQKTNKSDVLYLSLEDTEPRLKSRIAKLGDDWPSNFRMATKVPQLGEFEQELKEFLRRYPNTKLVVVDTFQKIRQPTDCKNGPTYGGDYADIGTLKEIADSYGICILLIHHLRKMRDTNNPFNELCGTTGMMGASDSTFLLRKDKRMNDTAEFIATGRDVPNMCYILSMKNGIWELIETKTEEEIKKEAKPSVLADIISYIKKEKQFHGSATELLSNLKQTKIKPNKITGILSTYAYEDLKEAGISYASGRTGASRYIDLRYEEKGTEKNEIIPTEKTEITEHPPEEKEKNIPDTDDTCDSNDGQIAADIKNSAAVTHLKNFNKDSNDFDYLPAADQESIKDILSSLSSQLSQEENNRKYGDNVNQNEKP